MNKPLEQLLSWTDAGYESTASGDISGQDPEMQEMEAARLSLIDLRFLLDRYPFPAFITDAGDQTILVFNANAAKAFPGNHLTGKSLSSVLCYRLKPDDLPGMAYFDREWRIMEFGTFKWGEKACNNILLKQYPGLPDPAQIQSARDMAALVLHRLRSPLTGMQGYIDLLTTDMDSETIQKRVAKLHSGMEQLNAILNELESLHTLDWEYKPVTIRIASAVMELTGAIDEGMRKRIQIRMDKDSPVIRGNREKLTKVLKLLVTNALEHPSGKNFPVIISSDSPLMISITNYGDPVPEYIRSRMFYPFVTDKARHIGLGLTLAALIARQMGITIIPVSNSVEKGITFRLLLPPD